MDCVEDPEVEGSLCELNLLILHFLIDFLLKVDWDGWQRLRHVHEVKVVVVFIVELPLVPAILIILVDLGHQFS